MRIRFLAAPLVSAAMISAAALALAMAIPTAAAAATRAASAGPSASAPAQSPTTVAPSDVANKGDVHDATVDGVIGIIEGSVAILMAGAALIILFLRRPGRRPAA